MSFLEKKQDKKNSKLFITGCTVRDIRFPTSRTLDGSDAMHVAPDYSAAYITLHTNHPTLAGHGFTFTIGRGNELCVAAIHALSEKILHRPFSDITQHMGDIWRELTGDSQLRWLGPEKGVIHLATAAIINALWDLWARFEKKPLWRLIADMSPEEIVHCLDFRSVTDFITPTEATDLLREKLSGKAERIAHLLAEGYPAYATSAGWLGYSDEKLRAACLEAKAQGWTHLKFKVGADLQTDIRRLEIARSVLGEHFPLMIDANQVWEIEQAITWIKSLARFNPLWIEEPIHPDDILGHATIRAAIHPMGVATGEHCHNRVMFKQFFQAKALDFCQIDSCRLGGVNEVLIVLLMAAKANIPVCPHAGGVGLCEYVQHLGIIDYVAISGSLKNRMLEYAGHLHEHFVDPVVIKQGRYQVPMQPGYSAEIKEQSLLDYTWPTGSAWQTLLVS